ncbi:MAG: hypothetical protein ACYDEF_10795 [Methanosarcina sp.]
MTEKRKRHFKVGEVKSLILEIILDNDGPIKESDVQRLLKDKFESFDQSTINRHLRYLNGHGCIEKISQIDKSRSYWDIENFENIKHIRSEFKDIKLNNYEKIIIIVLRENGYDAKQLDGFFIYFQLFLSGSFFKACIDTSMETLHSRIRNIYIYKQASYKRYILDLWDDSFDAYNNHPSTVKLTKDCFDSVFTKFAYGTEEIQSIESLIEKWNEKIKNISNEPPFEFNDMAGDEDLMPFNKIRWAITSLKRFVRDYDHSFFSLLFEAYFYQDVLLDVASKEEIDFVVETKASSGEFNALYSYQKDNTPYYRKMILSDLKEASKLMKSHKQPSFFDKKIYDNEDDIRLYLEERFDKEIQERSKSINYSKNEHAML